MTGGINHVIQMIRSLLLGMDIEVDYTTIANLLMALGLNRLLSTKGSLRSEIEKDEDMLMFATVYPDSFLYKKFYEKGI